MVQLPPRPAVIRLATTILLLSVGLQAQMTHRLKGSIRSDAGEPLAGASMRADVLSEDQRQALAAAINDLQAISRVQ